jgi:hypothetical protein
VFIKLLKAFLETIFHTSITFAVPLLAPMNHPFRTLFIHGNGKKFGNDKSGEYTGFHPHCSPEAMGDFDFFVYSMPIWNKFIVDETLRTASSVNHKPAFSSLLAFYMLLQKFLMSQKDICLAKENFMFTCCSVANIFKLANQWSIGTDDIA